MACSSFEDPMIHFHCVFLKLLYGFVERQYRGDFKLKKELWTCKFSSCSFKAIRIFTTEICDN